MVQPSQTQSFKTQRFVEFADTDMAGIAHFSGFFRWMEAAEHELLRSLGLSVFSELDEGYVLSFPRVSATCDYHSPARCEQTLDIAVTIQRLGVKSVTYDFHFAIGETKIATGRMTSVCCHIVHGKPPESVAIPESIAAGLRPLVVGS